MPKYYIQHENVKIDSFSTDDEWAFMIKCNIY